MLQGMNYILAVYQQKNFSKAAQILHISQPSLSANVKRVEENLGYSIFDRSTKPISLTEFGKEYIRMAEQVEQLKDSFTEFQSDYSGLNTGSLTLGGSSFFAALILPRLMKKFHEKFPNVRLNLVEETTHKLEEALHQGQVDLVLDNTNLSSDLYERIIYAKDYLILAVPKMFEINQKLVSFQLTYEQIKKGDFLSSEFPSVPLIYFKDEDFVLLREDNDTGNRALHLCRRNYFEPKVLFEVEQQLTAYHIVSLGMGVSFLGDALVSRSPKSNEVIYYKLEGPEIEREIYFYWKKNRYETRAMTTFLNECRNK